VIGILGSKLDLTRIHMKEFLARGVLNNKLPMCNVFSISRIVSCPKIKLFLFFKLT
jgi:hypothetical protein